MRGCESLNRNTEISADDAQFVKNAAESYYDEIYLFLCRRCGNEDDAKDICQNTFVKFACSMKSYKEKGRARAYLFTIAVNCCNDYYRQKKEHLPLDSVEGIKTGEAESPEKKAETDEESRRVKRILGSLPPIQRDVLILRYYHDMKPKEIASCTGLTVAGVKTRFVRAKKAFSEEWENDRRKA